MVDRCNLAEESRIATMGLDVVQHGFVESVKDAVNQFWGVCSGTRKLIHDHEEDEEV